MRPEEFESWLELRQALYSEYTLDYLREDAKSLLEQDYTVLLAHCGSALCGFAEVALRPFVNGAEANPAMHLESLFVLPGYRRKGIARHLVEAVADYVRTSGFSELTSDVQMDNHDSLKFHDQMGFAETERIVYFRKAL